MEVFRCAACGNALSVPVRLVELPPPLHWSRLDHHGVNPPLLAPGTYALDPAPYLRERITGTFVLSPGDLRGTRFVHDLVEIGCWSLAGSTLCVACERCGAPVAFRTDDCNVAQEARFHPAAVTREPRADDAPGPVPFASIADWDAAPDDGERGCWAPEPYRPRPELTATRWGGRDARAHLFRDDPPA
ncbi:hypothetical protein [Dactylosporangium sp. CS-033363]|uniref:hypothetical protein n=1 Tax=Dactylosporangium sp. CS-033363 TaxID=3239935 RepID=UPI003D8E5349